MSPQRQSSLFGDRHTHTHTHTKTHTPHTHTRSVTIHQSSKVGYACHFRSPCLRRCVNSPSTLFIFRLKVRSAAAFPSHPSHNVPYAMPHCDRRIKRWIKSKLWPFSSPAETDAWPPHMATSLPARARGRAGHTHTLVGRTQPHASPLFYDSSGVFPPASSNTPPSSL